MEQFLEQSFNALTLGGIYALIAVGYTMVYGIIKLVNFAHGEIYMIGAFAGVILLGHGVPFWLALPLAMLFCALLGALIDWLAYKPLRKSPRLAALITAIGISLILQNVVMLILGPEPRAFPTLSSEFLVWLEVEDTPESPQILQEFTLQMEKRLKAYQERKFEDCSFLKVYQENKKVIARSQKKMEDAIARNNEKDRLKYQKDYEKRKESLLKQEQEMPRLRHFEILSSYELILSEKREKPKIAALLLDFNLGTEDNAAIKTFSSAKSEVIEQLKIQYPNHQLVDQIDLVPHFFNKVIFPGLTYKSVFILLTTFCLMFCLEMIIHRTKLGTAMRACALDKTTASLMGVHVDQIISSTFMIGSALAAVAGVLYGLYLGSGIGYRMGYYAGVIAFASAVLGGIGNIRGAILGGFILGFVQVFANTYFTKWLSISSAYDFAFSFGVLILCILIRPTGILGTISAERA